MESSPFHKKDITQESKRQVGQYLFQEQDVAWWIKSTRILIFPHQPQKNTCQGPWVMEVYIQGDCRNSLIINGLYFVRRGREACIVCANSYGVTDNLKSQGFELKGMGKPLTDYLKSGAKVLTF